MFLDPEGSHRGIGYLCCERIRNYFFENISWEFLSSYKYIVDFTRVFQTRSTVIFSHVHNEICIDQISSINLILLIESCPYLLHRIIRSDLNAFAKWL